MSVVEIGCYFALSKQKTFRKMGEIDGMVRLLNLQTNGLHIFGDGLYRLRYAS